MIFYLTKYLHENSEQHDPEFKFEPQEVKLSKISSSLGKDFAELLKGRDNFEVTILDKYLKASGVQKLETPGVGKKFATEGDKIEPSPGDVLIVGDDRYGVGSVSPPKKVQQGMEYKLYIYTLRLEKVGTRHSFDRVS